VKGWGEGNEQVLVTDSKGRMAATESLIHVDRSLSGDRRNFVILWTLVAETELSNLPDSIALPGYPSAFIALWCTPGAHFQSFLMSKDHLNCRWMWLSSSTNLETAS
jgi:hypothetical protein